MSELKRNDLKLLNEDEDAANIIQGTYTCMMYDINTVGLGTSRYRPTRYSTCVRKNSKNRQNISEVSPVKGVSTVQIIADDLHSGKDLFVRQVSFHLKEESG